MIKYDRDWLENVCSKIDLLDYASHTHDFRRCGHDSYCTKCEKHHDTDPSLVVTPSRNVWFCYGCKRGGNIINWIMVYEGLSFPKAVEKVASLAGVDIPDFQEPSSLSVLNKMRAALTTDKKAEAVERKELDLEYWNHFKVIPHEPEEWIAEGISEEVLRRYDIRIDTDSNRIVYPVHDARGRLIGVKGRTRYKNYKLLGISKYMNYQKIGTVDYFQGMYENRDDIIKADEAIVFEGIKSVMHLATWGQNNGIAAETSRMNDAQVEILIRLGVGNVVIAFDNDVPYKQIRATADKLKRYMNVYVIVDKERLLGDPSDKRSPVDCGKEIWDKLYEERKRII